jgi:hypothetical protein
MICQQLETSTDVVMFPKFEENSPKLLKAAENYVKSMFSLKSQNSSQTPCTSFDSLEQDFVKFEKSKEETIKSSTAPELLKKNLEKKTIMSVVSSNLQTNTISSTRGKRSKGIDKLKFEDEFQKKSSKVKPTVNSTSAPGKRIRQDSKVITVDSIIFVFIKIN